MALESPYNSILRHCDKFLDLCYIPVVHINVVDYCMLGKPYKKPANKVSVNLLLPRISIRCVGFHYHAGTHSEEVTSPTGRGSAQYPDASARSGRRMRLPR